VDANAEDIDDAEDSGAVGAGKKDAAQMDLKSSLFMIVVAVLSVGCAFIFVTRIYSSKDNYDITASAVVPTSDSSSAGAESAPEDGKDSDTEKTVKPEKVKKKDKKKDKKGNDENSEKSSNSVLGKILVPMDSIVVNIGSVDSKRYLRVIISLEVKNSEIEGTINANKVVFRDKLVSFLSSKKISEVSDRANHQGLRVEIRDILNSDLLGADDAISQVYFSDFIIQ
jgi:flagellar basal body-associated protein FliL